MIKVLLIAIFSIISTKAYSAIMYSTGTFVPYYSTAQVDSAGSQRSFEINPYIGVGKPFLISGAHYFLPEVGYGHYLETPAKTNRSSIILNYSMGLVVNDAFIFRYGLSTHWLLLSGPGGSDRLNNGSSTTTFPAPGELKTSYTTSVHGGGEFFVSPRTISIRFDFQMMSPLETKYTHYNYLLTLNFYR